MDNGKCFLRMFLFLTILLLMLTIIEGTITTLPLVLIFLLLLAIRRRDEVVFVVAFISGLVLDILRLHTVGGTSLFLLCFLFLVLLYERKYEIDSLPFVILAAFVGTVGFGLVWADQGIIMQAVVSSGLAAIVFIFGKLGRLRTSDSLKF